MVVISGVFPGTGECDASAVDAINGEHPITVTGANTFTFTSSHPASFFRTDCNVPYATAMGPTPFEPLFDYGFINSYITGYFSVNTLDQFAENDPSYPVGYLATAGTLTVTASTTIPSDVGTYSLFPGGPGQTPDQYNFTRFGNLLFPLYPATIPALGEETDSSDEGLVFLGSGLEIYMFNYKAGDDFEEVFNQESGTNSYYGFNGPFPANNDPGGGQTSPAKYTFDVTAKPDCTEDYVVIGIPANAVSGGQANIVGYNNLYSNAGGSGFCPGPGPNVLFAYASTPAYTYSISSVAQSGTTVTVTTATENALVPGQVVVISGVSYGVGGCSQLSPFSADPAAAMDGDQTITGTSSTTFTFTSSVSASITSNQCTLTSATASVSAGGEVPGSVAISLDGKQLAYIEDQLTGNSVFHVLTPDTTGTAANNGTPTSAATPGTGNGATDITLPLSGGSGGCAAQSSTTSPFINYTDNAAYVTTYSWTWTVTGTAGIGTGCLYKISDVFGQGSSPSIEWSVPITAVPSSPVWDSISNNVFFTDSSGNIDYVTDNGTSPSAISSISVASGATSENPVTVDSTNQMVYATFNYSGGSAIVAQYSIANASFVTVPVGAGNTFFTGPYGVDFNGAFYEPTAYASPTPLLFVAGTGSGTVPTLYSIGFNGSGVITSVSSSTALATGGNGIADASAPTEFFNANDTTGGPDGTDYLFVGVTNNCAGGAVGTTGCVMSLNITGTDTSPAVYPTVSSATTAIAAPGGSTGLIVDNDAVTTSITGYPEASSVYYATKNGGTLVKATQSGLN
jgi:hypothetical protein